MLGVGAHVPASSPGEGAGVNLPLVDYYVCSQHRKRGKCEHARFHRLAETAERVERFVLSLIENPEALRGKVEERVDAERRALRNTDREARRVRSRLERLEVMEDGYSDQAAEGLMSMGRLREKLAAAEERTILQRRLAELVDRRPVVREHETVGAERTEGNPFGLYLLTRDSIRRLDGEELEEKRRAAEEERSQRFRQLYEMLDLRVVCHQDRSLEVTWSGGADTLRCPNLRGRG